jgi:hypothetical protein
MHLNAGTGAGALPVEHSSVPHAHQRAFSAISKGYETQFFFKRIILSMGDHSNYALAITVSESSDAAKSNSQ